MAEELFLREHQVDHYQRIMRILDKFYFYIDGSEMGTGKTYIAAACALTLKLQVLVVCPIAAKHTWQTVCDTYGVPICQLDDGEGIISYDSLRSIKGHQPKNGLLTRSESTAGVSFRTTALFEDLVSRGILLIFDECQKLKNTSDQHRAAKSLIARFYSVGGVSRIAFLSGTVMDKAEQAVNFLRMVNFIKNRNLYKGEKGESILNGMKDLYGWARALDKEKFNHYLDKNPFKPGKRDVDDHVFGIFSEIIKPATMSIMPSLNLDKDIKNGYFTLTSFDLEQYRLAVEKLRKIFYNDQIKITKENMGLVTAAMVSLQKAKMNAMVRKAKQELESSPNTKVILYADYYEVIDHLMNELSVYQPLELTGRIKEKQRTENISKFQQHDTEHRLMIANPIVGGMCVNLHDTNGGFPRKMYIMPGFRINELHQATGRTARDGLIGKAYVRFFYGKGENESVIELKLIDALARKGLIMQKVHEEQGTVFPNEYENEYED